MRFLATLNSPQLFKPNQKFRFDYSRTSMTLISAPSIIMYEHRFSIIVGAFQRQPFEIIIGFATIYKRLQSSIQL